MKIKNNQPIIPNLKYYKLELKKFWFMYLKIICAVVLVPLVFLFLPLITFCDWIFKYKCKVNYITLLYLHYVELTNMTVELP